MERRFRMARLLSAVIALVLAIVLFATGEWEVGLLVLALSALLVLRVYLVRDLPSGGARRGGTLPPEDDEADRPEG